MSKNRRQHGAQTKFKVALAASKGDKTVSELAAESGVHPTQISKWKRQLQENGAELFERNGNRKEQEQARKQNYTSKSDG